MNNRNMSNVLLTMVYIFMQMLNVYVGTENKIIRIRM